MKKMSTGKCKRSIFCGYSLKKVFSGLILMIFVFTLAGCKGSDYKKATGLFESEDFSSAQEVFDTLGDYKDSKEKSKECLYQIAMQYYKDNDYKNAVAVLAEINDYDKATQAIHTIVLKLINDEYVPELTKTTQCYSTYLNSESKKFLTWVYSGMENDYEIDYSSYELKILSAEKSILKDITQKINNVFTAEILEKCDDSVKNVFEKFTAVDTSINKMYTVENTFNLISGNKLNGSTGDMVSVDECTSLVSKLENALKELKSD